MYLGRDTRQVDTCNTHECVIAGMQTHLIDIKAHWVNIGAILCAHYQILSIKFNLKSEYENCTCSFSPFLIDVNVSPAAGDIISKMNFSVDPCEDFFQFACGGWIESHHIPADGSSVSVFGSLSVKVDEELKGT